MKKLILISLCLICSIHADINDDITTEIHEDDLLERAKSRLEIFQQELDWLVAYTEGNIPKTGDFKKIAEEDAIRMKELKKDLQEMHRAFLHFRRKICDVLLSKDGSYPYTNSICISTIDEVTSWYIHYVEDLLFPEGWNSIFKTYQLEKKRVNSIDYTPPKSSIELLNKGFE